MVQQGFFSHDDPQGRGPGDRVRAFDASYTGVGENIAQNASAAAACAAWMASPGHRANILRSEYRYLGVGYAEPSHYVQVFSLSSQPSQPNPTPSPQPTPPPPAPSRATVQLSNGDDIQTVYLNERLIDSAQFNETKTVDLGYITGNDQIRVDVTNKAGGYAWGIEVFADGIRRFQFRAGAAGVFGAYNNDLSRPDRVVYRVVCVQGPYFCWDSQPS